MGMDPNQIRLQLSRNWSSAENPADAAELFSQVMWKTIVKESVKLDGFGSGGPGGGMYADWAKEGFSAAIAAQLAKQSPLPLSVGGPSTLSQQNS